MTSKARIALASVLFIGFLFGAVFPTKTYLNQRREIAAAAERLELFKEQNGRLQAEVERLGRDDEIERLARERFNLVRPGEEAYAILPAPEPPPTQEPLTPRPESEVLVERDKPGPILGWIRNTLRRFF